MSISTRMEKFQEIMKQLQEMDIRTYEQLNEDNQEEAKLAFIKSSHSRLRWPNLKHNPEKLKKLARQGYALANEIKHEIGSSECSDLQKMILETVRMQIFDAHQYALRVLTQRSDLDVSYSENLDELLKKFNQHDVIEEKRQLERMSLDYYCGNRTFDSSFGASIVKALLRDSLAIVTDNRDEWSVEDQKYLEEIRWILGSHGLNSAWTYDEMLDNMICRPDQESLEKLGRLAQRKLAPLLERIPDGAEIYSADTVVGVINEFLKAQYGDRTKFRAVKDTQSGTMAAYQKEREMRIPEHRSKGPIDWPTFYAKVGGHEATHVIRGIPYELTELPVLSTGFLGYEKPEEGLTTAVEKALGHMIGYEVVDRSPIDYYVNIGLATRFYFGFVELFTLRRNMLYLQSVKKNSDRQQVLQSATNNAYGQIRRVFRGTGYIVDHKDLWYYDGEQIMWSYVRSDLCYGNEDKFWATYYSLGKVDPRDRQTLKILNCIMDSDEFPLTKEQLKREEILPYVFSDLWKRVSIVP